MSVLRRAQGRRELPGTWLKNGVLVVLIAILVLGLYESTGVALERIYTSRETSFISPAAPLHLLCVVLLVLVSVSSLISALATLFLAKDLDLILAAPLSWGQFFVGKLAETVALSSWFPLLFVVPMILAFGAYFHVPGVFYISAVAELLVLLVISGASAIALVTLIARVIPAARTRSILIAAALLMMIAGYLTLQRMLPPEMGRKDVGDLFKLIVQRHAVGSGGGPAWLAASSLDSIRQRHYHDALLPLISLLTLAALSSAIAYGLLRTCFEQAYSRARSVKSLLKINSRIAQRRLLRALFFVKAPTRALIAKEYKLFARDMIQALQMLVLLGLCVVYLYNFQVLRLAGESAPLTAGARPWWDGILVLLNLGVGGLVIATVCMRFVFPSVSLEGQAYWILQKAPLSAQQLLKAKFWCWLVPLGGITCVIMASGAFAIQAEPHMVAVSALVSWIFCYGVVGLAVGLGAFFANFQWEHPTQLTASFGALVYLLLSVLLVSAAMIPTAVLIFLRTARQQGFTFPPVQWALFVTLASGFVVYMNFLAHRWALKLGVEALERPQ